MTKREHDLATRINFGSRMASDERDGYRATRGLPMLGSGATCCTMPRDRLAERAGWRRRHPGLAVLDIGSRYRAPTEWRLMRRLPRLP
jgi:hypothetical protein